MTELNIGDRVEIEPPSHVEGRIGKIVNISRDCAGRQLFYIELAGPPFKVGDREIQIVDSHREGLRKIK